MDKENWTKWFPFKVTSYRADTAHLSLAQHGAYTLLLGEQWLKGGIKNDDKAIQRVLMGRHLTDGVQDVLNDFFILKDGFYKNPHLEAERTKAEDKYSNRVENGKKNIVKRWVGKPTLVKEKQNKLPLEPYCFEGVVIKLKEETFEKWKTIYPMIDLKQQLLKIDLEFQNDLPKNWFTACSAKLNYQNNLSKPDSPKKPVWKGVI